VILSLNRNEAKVLYRALTDCGEVLTTIGQVGEGDRDEDPGGEERCDDPEFLGTALCKLLPADMLVIHTSGISLAWHKGSIYTSEPLFIPKPILSTGAGDHFNAGFCSGLLMGFDPGLSLLLANTVAGYYMQHGRSPDIEALVETIL
jgi:sugar/nucleoside kinase (ribokinase family)